MPSPSIAVLVEQGHEDTARERYTDRAVDDWFRADGWDLDVDRGFVAKYDNAGMIVNGETSHSAVEWCDEAGCPKSQCVACKEASCHAA